MIALFARNYIFAHITFILTFDFEYDITDPRKLSYKMKFILHKKIYILQDKSCNTKLTSAKIKDTLLLVKSNSNIHPEPTPSAAPNPLLTFSQISGSNMSKLIRSSPSKSCDL